MEIRFLSSNKFKIEETRKILALEGLNVIPLEIKIEELQTLDTERLVKDKLLKAFKFIGKPLFIEHTGLYMKQLNGFPGGLTQIFWDKIGADKFSDLFGKGSDTSVIARTHVGFCDGKKYFTFNGEIEGNISEIPKGNRDFQWDCVFIPNGFTQTFSELGDKKNEISMRRIALEKLSNFLKAE
jgi:XTP/dITP diphosphohydrolase